VLLPSFPESREYREFLLGELRVAEFCPKSANLIGEQAMNSI